MKIILSIDGGGIRGIVSATILSYIEKKIQQITQNPRLRLGDLVDFVAGTSTGSIIGSFMLIPNENRTHPMYSMDEIINIYFDLSENIFKKKIIHNLKSGFGLFGPKYPDSNIEEPILKYLNHYKMKDLLKSCMFSGYDIEKRRANFFTNNDDAEKYGHYYVKDVVRGSTSIPSFFNPVQFHDGVDVNTIISGDFFASNPSLAAYVEISKTIFKSGEISKKRKLQDIIVISIGSGKIKQTSFNYKKTKKWNKSKWMIPILDIILNSNAEVVDYEMRRIFETYDLMHNYNRLNPPIINGDLCSLNVSKKNLINLIKDAENYIKNNERLLNTLAREIVDINCLLKFLT